VETAVSGIFVVASLPLALVSSRPLKWTSQWLESSAFTIIWSLAYLHFNLKAPNLLTKENLSRNLALRGDIENSNNWPKAPLSNRLFMMVREMPSYLSTAYALRFKDIQPESGKLARLRGKIDRYKQLIGELLRMGGSRYIFNHNIERLDSDFGKLDSELNKTNRAICAYFVSANDHNGAILGNHVYYYHHYKIGSFQKHFDVSAKVVRSTEDMFKHLNNLKATYPDRPIKVVDIVAHGSSQSIDINLPSLENSTSSYHNSNVTENEFQACSPNAAIILDSCSTGAGTNSIAKRIAEQNPGKKIYAPGAPLFFSKPAFSTQEGTTRVDHVTHGFAIVNAYTSREFQVATA
jgi:hypothetical protein